MRKFTLLTVAFLFIASLTNAQISRGTILLGGSISANTNKTKNGNDESKSNGFSIYPAVGFTVKENTVVGVRGGYSHSKSDYNNNYPEQENNGYSLGVFMRKYLSLGKNFYLFGEGGLGYNHQNNSQTSSIDSKYILKGNGVSANLYPGIAYALNKRIHLEASINNLISLGYYTSKTENITIAGQSSSKSNGFSFDTNVSASVPLSLGFRFVLGK